MSVPKWFLLACGFSGMLTAQTDLNAVPSSDSEQQIKYAEPDCPFFGPDRERFYTDALRRQSGMPPVRRPSATTDGVPRVFCSVCSPGGGGRGSLLRVRRCSRKKQDQSRRDLR